MPPSVALAGPLPSPVRPPAPLRARMRHCFRGPLDCDECLAVLALCLATELKFDRQAAEEMSTESYLAALQTGHAREFEARELRALTANLCTGISLMGTACSGTPSAEPPGKLRGLLLWLSADWRRFAALWLLLLSIAAIATIAWRR